MPRIKALEQKYRQFDTSQMIRGFQARAGKSQADMAEILGITQQAYSKRLLNLNFTLKDLQRMRGPLQLSSEEILGLVTGKEGSTT